MRTIQSPLFRILGMFLALSMAGALTAAIASAQTYPTKPVRFLILYFGCFVAAGPVQQLIPVRRAGRQ